MAVKKNILINLMVFSFGLSLFFALIAPEQEIIDGKRVYSCFATGCHYLSILLLLVGCLVAITAVYLTISKKREKSDN